MARSQTFLPATAMSRHGISATACSIAQRAPAFCPYGGRSECDRVAWCASLRVALLFNFQTRAREGRDLRKTIDRLWQRRGNSRALQSYAELKVPHINLLD